MRHSSDLPLKNPELRRILRGLASSPAEHAVAEHIDWPALVNLAKAHRLIPLLYLRRENLDAPASILLEFKAYAQGVLARNLELATELDALAAAFDRAAIPVLAFKGPVLAVQAHGNMGLRVSDDLDLMVLPPDVERAHAILADRGYAAELALNGWRGRCYRRTQIELSYRNRAKDLWVDLHWGLAPPGYSFAPEMNAWMDGQVSVPLPVGEVRTFGPEESLLLLCQHGTKHGWSWLIWVADVAGLLQRNPELDLARAASEARRLGLLRMLLLGLRLAKELCGSPWPAALERDWEAEASTVEALLRIVYQALERGEMWAQRSVAASLIYPRAMPRASDRWRSMLCPSLEDWKTLPLPGPLCSGYYLIRPLRLLVKHLTRTIISGGPGRIRTGE